MIKRTTELKQVEHARRFCGVCGKELHWELACSVVQCAYCEKDLCDDCVGHEEDTGGDYRVVWCKRCWDVGEEYRPKIEKLETLIESLYDEWQNRCKS